MEDEGREEGEDSGLAGKEQLFRRKIVRIIGSKISAGERPSPPPLAPFVIGLKRCECSFGSLVWRRLSVSAYVLSVLALSPVTKASGRGRLRRLAREVKACDGL